MDEQTRASRARFLGTVGAAGVVVAGGAWKTSKAGAAAAPGGRSYAAGRFALELEGSKGAGMLDGVEGGDAVGEVVREVGSAPYYQKKHIGNVRYEHCTVDFGMSMPEDVYDWISGTLTGKHERKSGALLAADFNYAVKARREFSDALITEVAFPALDAASKETAYFTVKFAPAKTVDKPGSGQLPVRTTKQKAWLPANFRLDIKGLPTGRVSKIDALTIKQTTAADDVGDARDYEREPGKLEIPNLVITLPESDAQPWQDWFADFVLRGNNGQEAEKSGRLTYLAPNMTEELARLDLGNLGIFKISPDKADAGGEMIRRVKIELYVETIAFTYLVGAPA